MFKNLGLGQNKIIITIAALIFLIILLVTQYQFSVLHPGGNDSLPRWLGTKYWVDYGLSPYSERVSQDAQRITFGRLAYAWEDQQYFVYPFYVTIFYLPIVGLPYEVGRALGMLGIEIALALSVFLSARMFKWSPKSLLLAITIGWAILFYNGFRTIILWQPAGIVAGLIAVSLWACKEKRDILAGVCLALATIKPQMTIVIVPFLMLWALYNRRWKLVAGFGSAMLILVGLSFFFVPTWLTDMLNQMNAYENYTEIGSLIGVLVSKIPQFMALPVKWFLIAIFLGWLTWEWWRIRNSSADDFNWVLAFTLVITAVIVDRTATTNQLLMLPAVIYIFAMLQKKYGKRSHRWVFVILVVYFIASWLLFGLAISITGSIDLLWPTYLPMPFLLLVGMILTRPLAMAAAQERVTAQVS